MAQSEAIQLRAQAKKLNIQNYRTMGLDELRKAVEGSGSGGAKRKSADNGGPKRKTAAAIGVKSKRKTATAVKKAPAKKAPAAKSASAGKAKRSSSGGASKSAGANVTCQAKGCRRKAPAMGRYAGFCDKPEHRALKGKAPAAASKRKSTVKATRSAPARKQTRGGKDAPGRAPIDNASVDWSAEWNGGQKGNRKVIMTALRRHKGDKDKVFKALSSKATTMYPKQSNGRKRSKDSAESLLRWHIGRVAFDFVMATGQHESSTNRKASGSKPAQKRSGAAGRSASPKGGRKSGSGSKTRQTGSKRKTSTKKKTGRK